MVDEKDKEAEEDVFLMPILHQLMLKFN